MKTLFSDNMLDQIKECQKNITELSYVDLIYCDENGNELGRTRVSNQHVKDGRWDVFGKLADQFYLDDDNIGRLCFEYN